MKRDHQETIGNKVESSSSSMDNGKGKSWFEDDQDAGGGMDELLAVLGYKIKSSDMADVAQKLEQLEMVLGSEDGISHLASDTVHYNPSDLCGWVQSMLSECNNLPSTDLDSSFLLSSNRDSLLGQPPAITSIDFSSNSHSKVFTDDSEYDLRAIPGVAAFPQQEFDRSNDRKRMKLTPIGSNIAPAPSANSLQSPTASSTSSSSPQAMAVSDLDKEGAFRTRKRPGKDGTGRISVMEVIAADEKRSDIEYELSQKEIYLEKVKRIGSMGLPDGGGLRATAWKLLLGYLSPSHDLWEKELTENRQKYVKLKEELLLSPSEYTRVKEDAMISAELSGEHDDAGPLKRHGISHGDHPLSIVKASAWHHYFKIDRDLLRTHPDLKFFSGESSFSKKNREAMRCILLLFAKLNPAIRYVQGMNEVLAPIFYVFSTDTDEKNAVNAEADSFFCFVRLLSDSVDHFCQQLDNSPVGILSTLSRLAELLKENDEELWKHLEFTTKVKPQFYAFRWITLLLTQEFNFQSILRIWDSLLSNPFGIQDMLLRICCAMLLCMKSRLLSGDFSANLRLLQHYPDINIEHLLRVAQDLSADTSSYSVSL